MADPGVVSSEARSTLLRITDAPGAVSEWIQMIRDAMQNIGILAYTFDLAGDILSPVADALCAARQRGVDVRIVIDAACGKGTSMRNLRPAMQRLIRYGIRVRTSHGRKRLHAKVLLADRKLPIGSCNWSENSQKRS